MPGPAAWIGYSVNEYGYGVVVYDADSDEIDRYDAGNHARDSQGYVERGHPERLPKHTLRRFAKQTALEIAAERQVDPFYVREE